ncbi:MAG: aspartate--tRNA ligase [Caldilineaceae bacterium SB0662_bin_25]|nr:aspartate--tRNA ligase [Caldilineaceae bacterium SB0662_bin_25]
MLKTHTCGELRAGDAGKAVTLSGWVNRRRDHGGLIFLDLRDRFGITQVTVSDDPALNLPNAANPSNGANNGNNGSGALEIASQIRSEFVVKVSGSVQKRPQGFENPELETGEIEVIAADLEILSEARTPPFVISGSQGDEVDEAVRLKYRYLDLRRPKLSGNLRLRHEIVRFIRNFFYDRDFLEVETPILLKSTPEGARDFVVPSRIHPGRFYALPQSPQQMKQLLMIGGFERYFQIARCFRDEDLRADRQPEFTQLDLEMSFVEAGDVMALIEEMLISLSAKISDKPIQQTPFPVLTYDEAMAKYGIDRPDIRFGLQLFDVTEKVRNSRFGVFRNAVAAGGIVKGVRYPHGAKLSRKETDDLIEYVRPYGAKGLAWIGITGEAGDDGNYPNESLRSPIVKFLSQEEIAGIIEAAGAAQGDLILLVADEESVTNPALANLRLEIGARANLIDSNLLAFCWVVDFPLLEYDSDEDRWGAIHHPFTSARDEDWSILEQRPADVKAKAYDVVLNGWEIGGGSIRIHRSDQQMRMFQRLGLSESDVDEQFGHMLEAFQYGAPPHGGIAMGIERVVALYADAQSIREVMAFPKTATGTDLLLEAPSPVDDDQLAELHISVREQNESAQ